LMEQLAFAYAPFLASIEITKEKINLYLINDNPLLEDATITIQYLEKEAVIKQWTLQKNIPTGSHIVWKDRSILPKVDSQFLITVYHPSLPGGKYQRTIKGTHPSKQFMVPKIEDHHWSCGPLFPME